MNSKDSGGRLERFFTGKGFYIVLFLCAAVIGVSAWMIAAGNETMAKDVSKNDTAYSNKRVETVIIPPADVDSSAADSVPAMKTERPNASTGTSTTPGADAKADADTGATAKPGAETKPTESDTAETAAIAAPDSAAPQSPVWLWPVSGDIERGYSMSTLSYDVTMRDWRTHDGIDIAAPVGTIVTATRGGTVESIENDDLFGTVVTISHGDGTKAVYANLDTATAVSLNEAVEPGYIVGTVGETALAEVGQEAHLHFALEANGQSINPLDYLQSA